MALASSLSESAAQQASPGPGYSADEQRKNRRFIKWLLIFPAVLALSLIANGARQSVERGSGSDLAENALAEAYAKTPFTIRLPPTGPEGARIVRVFLDEPDTERGLQAYMLNVWYRTPDKATSATGRTVHIWQTNDRFLAREIRDPTRIPGARETIAGNEWIRVTDDRVKAHVVTTYSRRFADGITVTVDSADADLARTTVAALSDKPVALG